MSDNTMITMTAGELDRIINKAVDITVLKLKMSGLMNNTRKTAYEKTEELLYNYPSLKLSCDQPYAKEVVARIEQILKKLSSDIYYDIIPMTYFENAKRDTIANHFDTTGTTISRNKKRLMNEIKTVLFSDDMIYELFL